MSDNKTQEKKSIVKSFSIRTRLTIAFITFSLLVFFIGGGITLIQHRQKTIQYSFQKLEIINNLKKNELEKYFSRLKEQTIVLSDYDLFINAAKELKKTFRLSDSDNSISINSAILENHKMDLKGFYNGEYLSLLNNKQDGEYSLEDVFPDDEKTTLLQYLFIASNPNDFDSKKLYDKPINSGNYGLAHFKYHPQIRELALRYGIDDLYLIDSESGHIFYSLNKNPDFATSVLSGPYRNSVLAKNFKQTNKAELKNHVEISDLEFYAPSGLNASLFISSPVFADGKKIAVLAFQINAEKIDGIITNGMEWEQMGLEETGDIIIVGNDNKLRNNKRTNIYDSDLFYKTLKRDKVENHIIEDIMAFQSTALLLEHDYYKISYKPGIDNKSDIRKLSKNKLYSIIQNIDVDGLGWNIVTSITRKEALKEQRKSLTTFLFLTIGIILAAFLLGYYYSGSFVGRIIAIKEAIKILSRGEKFSTLTDTKNQDEIKETVVALNQLNERIDGASDFALSIGKGNFEMSYAPISEKDKLGVSLNEMKTSLETAKNEEQQRLIEERKRNWTTEGIAIFSDLLRRNNDDIEKLSLTLVGKLVEYLDASLAGIFLLNEDKIPAVLELSSSYAFDRQKFLTKEIGLGEGLVGTCAQEQKTIHLKEIPDDYVVITSGFGETKPKSILLVPMIVEEKIMGVIEIGSMNIFEEHQIKFIELIGENIGSTLISVKINAQTARLLEESKVRSEEMSAQEEEMRQNLEELQATQEEMKRIKEQEAQKEEERRAKEAEILNQLREQNQKMKEDHTQLEQQAEVLRAKESEMRQNMEELEAAQLAMTTVQKEMEEEKALMDALMDSIPDAIYFKDKNSKFIRISKNMLDIFNAKSYDEVLGKSDFDFQDQEHAQQAFDDEQKIIETGQAIFNVIEKETFEDGTVRYVSTTKMPLKDQEDNIVGTFGISRDITQIKELENNSLKRLEELSIKESELELEQSMFDALLELITDRITIKDKDGKYLRLSKAKYEALVNHGIDEPIGKSDLDIFGKEHFERAQKTENEVLEGKVVVNEVEKIKTTDGTYSWGATSRINFKDKNGNVKGTIAVTKNITDSKNNEIELQLFNELIKIIAEKLPSFLFGFDENGNIKYFIGKLSSVINPYEKSSIFDIFNNVKELLKKDENQYSFNYPVRDGNEKWNLEVFILKNSGTENGYIGFGLESDLSKFDLETKLAFEALLKTKESLEKLRKKDN